MTPRCSVKKCLKLLGKKFHKGITLRRNKKSEPIYYCLECYFANLREINERLLAV